MAKVIIGNGVSSYKVLAVTALLFLNAGAAFSADKLIALTFDDGPRPLFCCFPPLTRVWASEWLTRSMRK